MKPPKRELAGRFTIGDAMILVAGAAATLWIWPEDLVRYVQSLPKIPVEDRTILTAINVIARYFAGPVQPIAAVWTMTILAVALCRFRAGFRMLARQPGFMACLSATLAMLIVAPQNLAISRIDFGDEVPQSDRIVIHAWGAFTFTHAECGIAVAAAWLTQRLCRRWRPGPNWVDRCGVALGIYWIATIPMVLLPNILTLL